MAEISWIKITTGMFDDNKFDYIYSLPDADSIIIIWIRLLTLAGKCNAGGFVMLTENIPYTEGMLSEKFKKPLNTIKLAFQTFRNLKMIEQNDDGQIYISNWEKHQNIDGMERIKEQNRLRQQRSRENKKFALNEQSDSSRDMSQDSHDQSQRYNAIDIDIDLDKEIDKEIDKEKEKELNIRPPAAPFDTFWSVYPRKAAKQDAISAFKALLKNKASLEDIMTATINYADLCQGKEMEYIKLPATFLRKDRWRDYLQIDKTAPPKASKGFNGKPIIPIVKEPEEASKPVSAEWMEEAVRLARKLDGKL
jgi:phage replisome organizer, putative, N-terminal region